jgi:inner membrane transporter RhtA
MTERINSAPHRIPAPVLFLASGLTQYCGAAIAVSLFAVLAAPAVAWWRIAVSALVLLAWRRPWRQRWSSREATASEHRRRSRGAERAWSRAIGRSDLLAAALFGVVLATMNVTFYVAIDHLPLGTAVAIEFLGPVVVAGVTGRGWRDRAGIGVAAVGVVLLAGVQVESGASTGVVIGLAAILAAAAAWAGYILLGRRLAVRRDGISALAVGMAAGALVYVPVGVGSVPTVVGDWRLALSLLGVAVLSSVIPYAIEQVVLRRVPAARFAILLAMLPVTATLVGAIVLAQLPTIAEVIGILLVCVAIVLSAQPATRTRAADQGSSTTRDAPPPLP